MRETEPIVDWPTSIMDYQKYVRIPISIRVHVQINGHEIHIISENGRYQGSIWTKII